VSFNDIEVRLPIIHHRPDPEIARNAVQAIQDELPFSWEKIKVAPVDIKRKIEAAFRRSAKIDASRITVEASGSEVVLRGSVRSWAEKH
jgi:osmotically-inducible protein OsmY